MFLHSSGSSSFGAASLSSSPARHSSLSSAWRAQNLAANARLANVMASHATDDGNEDDDNELALFGAAPWLGAPRPVTGGNDVVGVFGRAGRSPSPRVKNQFGFLMKQIKNQLITSRKHLGL